jgi:hypothetical protein
MVRSVVRLIYGDYDMAKTYVNLDAAWLAEFGNGLAVNGVLDGPAARLIQIADHLESMDNKLQNLSSRTYEDGRRDERIAMLSRSNLPIQSVELNPDLAAAMAAVPVKKIPNAKVKPKKEPPQFKELDNLLLDVDVDDLF